MREIKDMKHKLWIIISILTMAMAITASAQDDAVAIDIIQRESGLTVTIQNLEDVVVHSLTAPEAAFANSTHIIETANSLVLIDTQFLLPFALDYRAYADSLGKPIERLIITHEHPDHFLGSEAFNDVAIYALEEVSQSIAENGQAEVDEKQAGFGEAIASTFVVPEVLDVDEVEIDGVIFQFETVLNAEAEIQVIITVPEYGIVSVSDVVYSGVHLILAGSPPSWIEALENLQANSADYPIVLAGHGLPGTPELYADNITWLSTAAVLMGAVDTGEEFKTVLVTAFPDLGMDAAIDFVLPFLFPSDD